MRELTVSHIQILWGCTSWCSINGSSVLSIPSLPRFDRCMMFPMPSLCHGSMIDSCYFPMFCDTIFTEIKYVINQPMANTVEVHTPWPIQPYTVRASGWCYWHPPDDALSPIPPLPCGGGAGLVVHVVLKSVVPGLIVMCLLSPVVVGAFGYQHMQPTLQAVACRAMGRWQDIPCHLGGAGTGHPAMSSCSCSL
jgi:hypothetical protein